MLFFWNNFLIHILYDYNKIKTNTYIIKNKKISYWYLLLLIKNFGCYMYSPLTLQRVCDTRHPIRCYVFNDKGKYKQECILFFKSSLYQAQTVRFWFNLQTKHFFSICWRPQLPIMQSSQLSLLELHVLYINVPNPTLTPPPPMTHQFKPNGIVHFIFFYNKINIFVYMCMPFLFLNWNRPLEMWLSDCNLLNGQLFQKKNSASWRLKDPCVMFVLLLFLQFNLSIRSSEYW